MLPVHKLTGPKMMMMMMMMIMTMTTTTMTMTMMMMMMMMIPLIKRSHVKDRSVYSVSHLGNFSHKFV